MRRHDHRLSVYYKQKNIYLNTVKKSSFTHTHTGNEKKNRIVFSYG